MSKSLRPKNSGFVLVTALIFLVVLTMISAIAMRGAIFDEKISGNQRDQILAQEAAEMALRDAELDIRGLRFDNTYCGPTGVAASTCGGNKRIAGTRPIDAAEAANFWIASNNQIFDAYNTAATAASRPTAITGTNFGVYGGTDATLACGKTLWTAADWDTDTPATALKCADGTSVVRTVVYGSFTGAPTGTDIFPSGTRLPRYLIEMFAASDLGISNSNKVFFRATAVGFGRIARDDGTFTSVTLQSVFSAL